MRLHTIFFLCIMMSATYSWSAAAEEHKEQTINIKDLDKASVLYALWTYARSCEGLSGTQSLKSENFQSMEYFGWNVTRIYDRELYVDISGDQFDPKGYDGQNGAGQAKQAIEMLRCGTVGRVEIGELIYKEWAGPTG